MTTADSSPDLPAALTGYPKPAIEAYLRYASSRSASDLEGFLLRTLDFLLERPEDSSLLDLSKDTHLMEDLGADSLLVAELVFLLEDLFEIELSNEDLSKIVTLGDLQALVQAKAT